MLQNSELCVLLIHSFQYEHIAHLIPRISFSAKPFYFVLTRAKYVNLKGIKLKSEYPLAMEQNKIGIFQ